MTSAEGATSAKSHKAQGFPRDTAVFLSGSSLLCHPESPGHIPSTGATERSLVAAGLEEDLAPEPTTAAAPTTAAT